jgi:ketosteroid isomerase-like protein
VSERLLAEAGVRELHARYVDAVWRRDWDAFADCWTEDAQWKIGGHAFSSREAIVTGFKGFMERYSHVLVTLRPPVLQIERGAASGRTYITEQNKAKDGAYINSIGIYYERFRRGDDDRWRRSWALFQLHYIGPADLSGTFLEQPDFGPPPAMPPLDAQTFGSAASTGALKRA